MCLFHNFTTKNIEKTAWLSDFFENMFLFCFNNEFPSSSKHSLRNRINSKNNYKKFASLSNFLNFFEKNGEKKLSVG